VSNRACAWECVGVCYTKRAFVIIGGNYNVRNQAKERCQLAKGDDLMNDRPFGDKRIRRAIMRLVWAVFEKLRPPRPYLTLS